MLQKLKGWIKEKEYTFTESEMIEKFKAIEQVIRKELKDEYKGKYEELQRKLIAQNTYILDLEKRHADMTLQADMLRAQLKEKETEDKKIDEELQKRTGKDYQKLSKELFGDA